MTKALITGITGQDGSYLSELLLSKNYKVIGLVHDLQNEKEKLLPSLKGKIELHQWDMADQNEIINILRQYPVDEIYNLAAYSSGSGMYNDPIAIAEVNGLGVTRLLEAVRIVNPAIRICQASSSEIYGDATESPQNETTKTNPRSPYGAAKLYADSMIKIYRNKYKIFACSAILYNHESPRRSLGFVTRKITNEAVKIKLGLSNELRLGNLDSYRDWGFAGDYVTAMWLMLQHPDADDYIVSTGRLHSVRDFCECAFNYLNLDYRDYLQIDNEFFRPSESIQLLGNAEKAERLLSWKPAIDFDHLVKMMVEEDLKMYNK